MTTWRSWTTGRTDRKRRNSLIARSGYVICIWLQDSCIEFRKAFIYVIFFFPCSRQSRHHSSMSIVFLREECPMNPVNPHVASSSFFLIVPGLHNSGPDHWQTWLETRLPHARRVQQADWEAPCLSTWAERVRQALRETDASVWIVAHSFGCLASVVAAKDFSHKIGGALLVAPANPERFQIPERELAGALPFPSRLVASANDPWMPLDSARRWSENWGCDFFDVGRQGHINADSGHGPWPAALEHLRALQKSRAGCAQHASSSVLFYDSALA
jgi:predicted alpha/beta hydrolase family esterase